MSTKGLIHAIVYTNLHDDLGPVPVYWNPSDLSENISMLVSIKTVTLLSASYGYVPESSIILPFPSIKLKGLVKYIEIEDQNRRGKFVRSAITFLFKETDDIIFYKYISHIEPLFSNTCKKIISLKKTNALDKDIFLQVDQLKNNVLDLLEELRRNELSISSAKEFPEASKEKPIEAEYKFKLIVLGDPGVGKTSTILRFADNAFSRTYIATVGVKITDKNFRVDNNLVELILWDLAGQIKFQTMRKYFYQGANGIILIYDLTNPKSFENISAWYKDIKKYLGKHASIVGYVFGNKLDLKNERRVKNTTAVKLTSALNLKYFETSALTGQNIENAFYNIAKELIELKRISINI